MEKYVVLNTFNNYAISNMGKVKNIRTNKECKTNVEKSGYVSVGLCQNGAKKTFRVHRLVALYFIDNPQNLPQVNHIDGNKQNNSVDNLEWCTAKQNDAHARANGLKHDNKPIIAQNIETGEKMVFCSTGEAGFVLGINNGTIHKVLKGKRNKTHGYTFRYYGEI